MSTAAATAAEFFTSMQRTRAMLLLFLRLRNSLAISRPSTWSRPTVCSLTILRRAASFRHRFRCLGERGEQAGKAGPKNTAPRTENPTGRSPYLRDRAMRSSRSSSWPQQTGAGHCGSIRGVRWSPGQLHDSISYKPVERGNVSLHRPCGVWKPKAGSIRRLRHANRDRRCRRTTGHSSAGLPARGNRPRTHAEIEITDPQRVAATLAAARPDCVINCAAYNFVDRAEDEKLGRRLRRQRRTPP